MYAFAGNRMLWRLVVSAGLPLFAIGASSALAQQAWPNRPLRLIVPLAPGGTSDILARTMGPLLTAGLGQPVVVENRGGAGGVVGVETAAKAPPDGYTMLLISSDTYTVNAGLFAKPPYDARKDLTPSSILASSPTILSVHPSLPVHSVSELVAYAKANPGKLNFGSGGNTDAKAWKDIWGCGQGIGAVKSVLSAGEYVAKLVSEYEAAKARIGLGPAAVAAE